jgi:hypothetical protein
MSVAYKTCFHAAPLRQSDFVSLLHSVMVPMVLVWAAPRQLLFANITPLDQIQYLLENLEKAIAEAGKKFVSIRFASAFEEDEKRVKYAEGLEETFKGKKKTIGNQCTEITNLQTDGISNDSNFKESSKQFNIVNAESQQLRANDKEQCCIVDEQDKVIAEMRHEHASIEHGNEGTKPYAGLDFEEAIKRLL